MTEVDSMHIEWVQRMMITDRAKVEVGRAMYSYSIIFVVSQIA